MRRASFIRCVAGLGPNGIFEHADMKKLILRNFLSPGDLVMLTAAIRDLHQCYPGQFLTDVRTPYPQLWENNPYLTPLNEGDSGVETIDCHYPLIHQSNERPYHFIHAFIAYLNDRLHLEIKPTAFKGDVHLSSEEKGWHSQVCEIVGDDRPFWLVASGGKFDFTNKWWELSRYQEVIDYFRDKILFVQVGRLEDHHPPLKGVIDLLGKTDMRQLIRLVYHSQGVLCPVTAIMHLSAAVPSKPGFPHNRPCVVVAGGREPSQWEAYPHHQFIHSIGALPCCQRGGCWKSRVLPLGDGDEKDRAENLCVNVVRNLPKCMDLIGADEVIRRVELYFKGGILQYYASLPTELAQRSLLPPWEELIKERELAVENVRELSEQVIATIPAYPKVFSGRGIVICAGGIKYFTNAWVCICMLRRLGCKLPIQLWHLGRQEVDVSMQKLVAELDVECVDASQLSEKLPCRSLRGWAIKPYAIVYSSFREVLLLDADNLPLVKPELLFEMEPFKETGAAFWPDYSRLAPGRQIWSLCGIPYRDEPEFESGQILVDKERCWRPLMLALWYNANADFYYQYIHGDKETFHMAFRKLEQPYAMPQRGIESLIGTMCQHDFEGKRIFQHRNLDKWDLDRENEPVPGFLHEDDCRSFIRDLRRKWSGTIEHQRRRDGQTAAVSMLTGNVHLYQRVGHDSREMTFSRDGTIGTGSKSCERRWDLEEKTDGRTYLRIFGESNLTCELIQHHDGVWRGRWCKFEGMPTELRLMFNPQHRDNTTDRDIWERVFKTNAYRLPEYFDPNAIIVDVGAHTGAFTCACITRGAKYIYAFEPNPENYQLCLINSKRCFSKHRSRERHSPLCLENTAIWRSDQIEQITLSKWPASGEDEELIDTGGAISLPQMADAPLCRSIGLDVLLNELPYVTLLKVSCAGAVWPILLTAQALAKVQQIVIQFPPVDAHQLESSPTSNGKLPKFTAENLKLHLAESGFFPYPDQATTPCVGTPATDGVSHASEHEPVHFIKSHPATNVRLTNHTTPTVESMDITLAVK